MLRSVPESRLTGKPGGLALADGLTNVMTGAGTTVDRRVYDRYAATYVDQVTAETAYRCSWLVRKVHDLPPFDMTREWRDWQAEKDQIQKLESEERRLGIRGKVQRALTLARLHGGGAIFLGFGDSDPSRAATEAVGVGGLKYVLVLSRYQLNYRELEDDLLSPFFGQPKLWQMSSAGQTLDIHPSRVIPFVGQAKPEGALGMGLDGDPFWGDPLLMSVGDGLKNAQLAEGSIASLLDEALVDVINIPDLMTMIGSAEYEAGLIKRLTLAKMAKSSHRALILDKDEEWNQKAFNFAGLPDILKLFLQVASGAADIPATRLLGQAPQGMNSTGDSDLRNYYDMLSSKQGTDLAPQLDRLDEALIPSALGSRPAELYWEFAPLWQMTPKERAEVDELNAKVSEIDARTGMIPAAALAKARQNKAIEDGVYPGLEAALEDAENGLLVAPVADPDEEEAEPDPDAPQRRAANDAAPRTLYVQRKLINSKPFLAWAKAQGFKTTTPADQLHVTVAFSRQPVDWMKVEGTWGGPPSGEITIPAGGARIVEPLGDKGAVVLLFNSSELSWRHEQIKRDAGASWDFDSYQPHVTITYSGGDLDLSKVDPYRGALIFGPEIFEEVVEDWEKTITEDGGSRDGPRPF